MVRKYHKLQTTPWHREEETPEWTYGNVKQYIEQFQTPKMGVTINNKSTSPQNGQQPKPPDRGGGGGGGA